MRDTHTFENCYEILRKANKTDKRKKIKKNG